MNHVWKFIIVISMCQGVSIARQCTAPGKYPNDQLGSCSGYTMCLIAGAGNFAQLNLTCPPGFIYNHVVSQCTNVTGYQCEPDFNCTATGNFRNPFTNDCFSYIACVEGVNDFMTARSIQCLEGQIFDPANGSCIMNNETVFKCHPDAHSFDTNELNVRASIENSSCRLLSTFMYSVVIIYILWIGVI